MTVKQGRVEANIYVELRSRGSIRFVVQVSPLPKAHKTYDLDQYPQGLKWARNTRIELLETKEQAKAPEPPP